MDKRLQLTQTDADRLLTMLKRTLTDAINFPSKGTSTEFEVIGESPQDVFVVKIYRGKINPLKYEMGARIKKDGILLLELHMNPGNIHCNPDGEKITGSHWHIYREGYGRSWALPAEDIQADQFVENTILFLDKFHVIKKPDIAYQE